MTDNPAPLPEDQSSTTFSGLGINVEEELKDVAPDYFNLAQRCGLGRARLKITRIEFATTQKGKLRFTVKGEVVSSSYDTLADGTVVDCSSFEGQYRQYVLNDARSAIAAALSCKKGEYIPSESVTTKIMDAAVGSSQPLAGAMIDVEVVHRFNKRTKEFSNDRDGNPITDYRYSPVLG